MKVSVFILTYNHERFVADAIEGALRQKTDFSYEIVIADDCSTDGTREVIRRYGEREPERIRVLLNRHNIGALQTIVRAFAACRGQYVAMVEGDDYWTNPDKLQRQVDFLDSHPDHTMCFHAVTVAWDDGSRASHVFRPVQVRETYTLRDLLDCNFIGTCSAMYRGGVVRQWPLWFYCMPVGDWCLHLLHAQHGDIGYLDEPMAVYRQHGGGVYSARSTVYRLGVPVEVLRRFRCVLGRAFHREIDRSLSRSYCALIHRYCEEGKLLEARQCLRQCLDDVPLGLHVPGAALLKAAARAYVPGLHQLGKRLFRRPRPPRTDGK